MQKSQKSETHYKITAKSHQIFTKNHKSYSHRTRLHDFKIKNITCTILKNDLPLGFVPIWKIDTVVWQQEIRLSRLRPVWKVCFCCAKVLCQRFTPCQMSKDNRHVLPLFLKLFHAKDIRRNIHVFKCGVEIQRPFSNGFLWLFSWSLWQWAIPAKGSNL